MVFVKAVSCERCPIKFTYLLMKCTKRICKICSAKFITSFIEKNYIKLRSLRSIDERNLQNLVSNFYALTFIIIVLHCQRSTQTQGTFICKQYHQSYNIIHHKFTLVRRAGSRAFEKKMIFLPLVVVNHFLLAIFSLI